MIANRRLSLGVASLMSCLSLSCAGGADGTAGDLLEAEVTLGQAQEALSPGLTQCAADALPSRSLATACGAVELGTVAVHSGAPDSVDPAPMLRENQAYGLHLVESSPGQFVGRFRMRGNGPYDERHTIFLGSPSVPISMRNSAGEQQLECGRYLSSSFTSGLIGGECSDLKVAVVTAVLPLFGAPIYDIEIGPTPSRWVRFFAAPQGRILPTNGPGTSCEAPPAALCTSTPAPVPVSAPGVATLHPPLIELGVVYGVRLTGIAERAREGSLAFVPPSTGSYLLNLGTPFLPVQIREEGQGVPVASQCFGQVPSSAGCAAFKATQLFSLVGGKRYRVELNGINDLTWQRLAITRATDAPETLPTVEGLGLWLRADRGVEASAGALTVWRDQSDAHRDAVPVSTAARPQHILDGFAGVPSVRFDGTDDVLRFPVFASTNATIFWVAKSNWADAGEFDFQTVLGGVESGSTSYLAYRDINVFDVLEGSFGVKNLLTPHLLTVTKLGDRATVEQADQSFSFAGPTAFAQIGQYASFGGAFLRADLSEMIMYTRALSPDERLATERYLSARYAITP